MVAAIFKCLVNRLQVLIAAHGGNKGVGRFENSGVVEHDAGGVPALLNFGVSVSSTVVVSINLGHDCDVQRVGELLERVLEDDLQV